MNTIIITVDALRADHLGQYGYDRNTMPVLDQLIDEGTLFENAYSNGPYTQVSMPSIHTSKYWTNLSPEEEKAIGEKMEGEGFTTAMIGSQTGFGFESDLLGFQHFNDLGRDDYRDKGDKNLDDKISKFIPKVSETLKDIDPRVHQTAKSIYRSIPGLTSFSHLGYMSAEKVTNNASEWLENNSEDDFFLAIQYMEGHRPYGVHEENPEFVDRKLEDKEIQDLMKKAGTKPDEITNKEHRQIIDQYDSDLRYCSRHLKRLLEKLKELDIWEETNIIFTADHGEEFYEHEKYYHRNLPYDELIHAPLVVKSDRNDKKVKEQKPLLDIAPTVLDLHEIEPESGFEGKSLFEDVERDVVTVGSQVYDDTLAIRKNGWKYITSEKGEFLFNLESDPRERNSLVNEKPGKAEELKSEIPERLFDTEEVSLGKPKDEEVKEKLEALGYMEIDRNN